MTSKAIYDDIGIGYSHGRKPDARLAHLVRKKLGSAQSVLNVGAGTGNYEPSDRNVIAVEPSRSMIAQRPTDAGSSVCWNAEHLPFADASFDAAIALSTIHHWSDLERELADSARISRAVRGIDGTGYCATKLRSTLAIVWLSPARDSRRSVASSDV